MKTLLAALVLLPGLASAQSSDSSFAAALCAVRAKAAAAAKAAPVKGSKPAMTPAAAQKQPSLKLCDEAMAKHVSGSYGGPTLMLQTETTAYYTHQDCDICDELDSCEVKTGKLATLKTAHVVSCEDLGPYRKGKIVYDACGPIR